MEIIKRSGLKVPYDRERIRAAIQRAFDACGIKAPRYIQLATCKVDRIAQDAEGPLTVEQVQSWVENMLLEGCYPEVAKAYILYRERHGQARFIRERLDYMDRYASSNDNAATSSETDANANVTVKNVANLEGEVYKTTNRIIQRQRMKDKLQDIFPEVAKQYEKDLESHVIYTHDEASVPTLKKYCAAVSLYPLMTEGVGNIDGVTPSAPNDLQSFSGQITNLAFLLSSQCKGAVAFGSYFVALNYYVIKEFGEQWYNKLDLGVSTPICNLHRTVRDCILKAFKQFVWGINQPAGNRSFQCPFVNISYYDRTYFNSLFGEFAYPDGTRPEWQAIDTLQRLFMNWFNEARLKQILTFPIETYAMVYDPDTKEIIDKEYRELCAEMYAKGHSFFTYVSDSADSLSSCCRLRNNISKNTFNPTSGLTGVMTGSCNVITLNINRLVQTTERCFSDEQIKRRLIDVLERVYKYHIAYKTMLYDMEDKGMFADSNAGYIRLSKLYSTIGINGLNEAARFLGYEVSNNAKYIRFLQLILGTVKEQNALHSVHDKKRPVLFNSEVVPAESLGAKNYNWDKADGLWVPDDENLYNSYFYNAHDNTPVLDKFKLHGIQTASYCDGGQAAHINLEDHLSKEQYLKLIDFACRQGTSYFTFNIPNSKCDDCGYITKHPVTECPKCGGRSITQYSRVIGYLRPIKNFGEDRQIEAAKRTYSNGKAELKDADGLC